MRTFSLLTVIVGCLCIIAFAFAEPTLERKARVEIVKVLREKFDAKVELGPVRLTSLWPLGLRVQKLKILPRGRTFRIEMESMSLRYFYWRDHPSIQLTLERPYLYWVGEPSESSAMVPANTAAWASQAAARDQWTAAFLSRVGVNLQISDGLVAWRKNDTTEVSLQNLDVAVYKSRALDMTEPLKVNVASELHYATPWMTGQTTVNFHSEDLQVSRDQIMSQNSTLQIGGLVIRVNGVSRPQESLHDWLVQAAVEDLAQLPKPPDFLPAQNWHGKLHLDAAVHMQQTNSTIQGTLKLEQVWMDMNWDAPEIAIQGPVHLETEAKFRWQPTGYEIKDVNLQLDMVGAAFRYGQLLLKPPKVAMAIHASGAIGSQSLDVRQLELYLNNFRLVAQGSLPAQGSGSVTFESPPTNLAGWEKLLPPLSGGPMSGELEMAGAWSGAWQSAKDLKLNFSKLALRNFQAMLDYKSKDEQVTLKGPVRAQADVKNGDLIVQEATIQTPSGEGAFTGKISVGGKFESNDWFNWPLKIGGTLNWTAAQWHWPAGENSDTALLRRGFLTENLDLKVNAKSPTAEIGKFQFREASVKAKVADGLVSGTGVAQFHDKSWQIKNFSLPFLQPGPLLKADVHVEKQDAAAVEQLFPELAGIALGPITGDVHVQTDVPGQSQWQASGDLELADVRVNTISLHQTLDQQLASVPGIDKSALVPELLQGTVSCRFAYRNRTFDALSLDAVDRGGSELQLSGAVDLRRPLDLKGDFHWARAPLSECLKKGDVDEKNRLLVPVALKGSIAAPSWSLASDLISKITNRAAHCDAPNPLPKSSQNQIE